MDVVSFQTTPGGTHGARGPGSNPLTRTLMRVMTSWHKRSGDKFQGMDLLYLTTVGAKTGQKRQSAVARFADGQDAWLVVASAAGSAHHPAWYHNIAAHPDQVWVEFGGDEMHVSPTQLTGSARAQAWQQITKSQPRYAGYQQKTDRAIPVIRLSRVGDGSTRNNDDTRA
jgi:deazaflavin-dependent oxidoreductase (nitroreductase family)